MKKFLIVLSILIGSLTLSAQKPKDSVLLSSKLGLVVDGGFNTTPSNSTIIFTHLANFPTRVVFKMDSNPDSAGTAIKTGDLIRTYAADDGMYYYYTAELENTKEAVTFAIKYNLDGKTFNSFGIIREAQQTIVVFFIDPVTKSL